jgi:hypothetical protein
MTGIGGWCSTRRHCDALRPPDAPWCNLPGTVVRFHVAPPWRCGAALQIGRHILRSPDVLAPHVLVKTGG